MVLIRTPRGIWSFHQGRREALGRDGYPDRGAGFRIGRLLGSVATILMPTGATVNETSGKEELMELGLDVRKLDGHSVVDVKGEIDVYTAPKLREKLIELVSEGSYDVVVNLEGVDFLDSTGLGVLVGALKRVKAHDGNLSLVCTQDKILKIFKITGLTKVFPIYDSVEEATSASAG
jgi:anti-sigma B factor antagonist